MKKLLTLHFIFIVGLAAWGQDASLKKAQEYMQLGDLLYSKEGKYPKAQKNYQKAAEIFQAQKATKDYFRAKIKVARCFYQTSQYNDALQLAKKLLEEIPQKLGKNTVQEADICDAMGWVYYKKRKLDQAKKYLQQALLILQNTKGHELLLAATYRHLGGVDEVEEQLDLAQKKYEKALSIQKKYLGDENHIAIATTYGDLGSLYFYKNDYKTSIFYERKALKIREKILGKEHPDIALSYSNLGATYGERGFYSIAQKNFQKALKIRKKVLGEQHMEVGKTYYNMGYIHLQEEAFDLALEYFHKFLTILKANVDPMHPYVAHVQGSIGGTYMKKGHYKKAYFHQQKYLEILKQRKRPGTALADAYYNMGKLHRFMNKNEQSLEYTQKALNVMKKVHNKPHIYTVRCYLNMAQTYRQIEDFDKAFKYFQLTVNTSEKLFGIRSPLAASASFSTGAILAKQKKYIKALRYYQKGFTQKIPAFSDSSDVFKNPLLENLLYAPFLIDAMISKAKIFYEIYLQSKDDSYLTHAIKAYNLCYQAVNITQRAYLKTSDAIRFNEAAVLLKENAINAYLTKHRLDKKRGNLAQALKFNEQFNANILKNLITNQKALTFTNIPRILQNKERELRSEVAYWIQKINTNPKKNDAYKDSLFKYNRTYEAFISLLEKKHPKYTQLKYQGKTVEISEIQTKLATNTALLEYSFGENNSYLIIIGKEQVQWVPIANNRVLIPLLNQYYSALSGETRLKHFAKASHQLYQKLLQPAEKHLKGKKRLLVIAPSLESIPFEALITQAPSTVTINQDDFSQLPYLVNQYQISYHYSATLWHSGTTSQRKASPRLIAFAPFSTGKSESISTKTRKSVDPLPESGVEVKTIFNLFNKKQLTADIFLANTATKERFVRASRNYNIVHIASHSEANTQNANLAKIRFAGCDDSKADASGCLFASEVYNLRLNVDLLVLSSCESGVGKLAKGEGVLSLARSFLYAGARNIVFSLWDVNDVYTRKLMEVFYKELLSNKNYQNALQNAQQKIIKTDKKLHPKHWAGFVMIGE